MPRALIRRHGHLGTEATLVAMEADADLHSRPRAAAHLIHGSSEGRFAITSSPEPFMLSRRPRPGRWYRAS